MGGAQSLAFPYDIGAARSSDRAWSRSHNHTLLRLHLSSDTYLCLLVLLRMV